MSFLKATPQSTEPSSPLNPISTRESQASTDQGITIGGRNVSVTTPGSGAAPGSGAPQARHPTPRSTLVDTPATPRGSSEHRAAQVKQRLADEKIFRQAHQAAEREMSNVIKALSAGQGGDVLASGKKFDAALEPLNKNSSSSNSFAGDGYQERLQAQLKEMPLKPLETLGQAAAQFLGKTPDRVVALLDGAIKIELARREEILLSADRHMAQFFRSLVSGNLSEMQSSSAKFNEALLSLKEFDPAYDDRLLVYLNKCSASELGAVGPAAWHLVENPDARVDEPLVRDLDVAVNQVLLERAGATFRKVDEHMANVLDTLASGDASKVPSSVQAFEMAVARDFPRYRNDVFAFNDSIDPSDASDSNALNERLQKRLRSMSQDQLDKVLMAAVPYVEEANNPVLARIGFSALAEYLRRQTRDLNTDRTYGALSQKYDRSELRDLAFMASRLIASAHKQVPSVNPTDRIPGTRFTLARLNEIKDGLDAERAIRIVREDQSTSVDTMTDDQRNEVAWAVKLCNDKKIRYRRAGEQENPYFAASAKNAWSVALKRLGFAIDSFEGRVSSSSSPGGPAPLSVRARASKKPSNVAARSASSSVAKGHQRAATTADPEEVRRRGANRSTLAPEEQLGRMPSVGKSGIQNPLRSALDEMDDLLQILRSEDPTPAQVKASSQRLAAAIQSPHLNTLKSKTGEDAYSSHLQSQLELMGWAVGAIAKAAEKFQSVDTHVARIREVALEVLADHAGLLQPWEEMPNTGRIPTAEHLADQHLRSLFGDLRSRNVPSANASNERFIREMQTPQPRLDWVESRPYTAEIYGERLRFRLREMPTATLEDYHKFAASFPDKGNPLVARIALALKTEIQRRDDVKLEKLLRLATADTHMKEVLDALRSNDDLKAGIGVENFVNAMQPPNSSTAISDSAAFDMYKDRLNKRLVNMPQGEVDALVKGVKSYLSNLDDPVVEGIRVAAEKALEQRLSAKKSFGRLTDGPSS